MSGDTEPTHPMRACVACGEASHSATFVATERLLGSLEKFDYWECPDCGCVQIDAVPDDLARHYPEDYFAYRPQHRLAANRVRGMLDPLRLRADLGRGGGLAGTLANRLLKPLDYAEWCRVTGLDARARVLDVGCGGGRRLVRLRHAGFARCLGLDPYIPRSVEYANGASVLKQSLLEFAGSSEERFDLVMFHHSLEHVPRPFDHLTAARELLAPGGWILVRVPVSGGHAWRTYREHWVGLDPPRHLFVPAERSMDRLARRCDLRVEHVAYDSTIRQFVVSEMFRRGITPTPGAERTLPIGDDQVRQWQDTARALNAARDGDQAAFYLHRP